MAVQNATKTQQKTRKIFAEYKEALAAGMNIPMGCILYYGNQDTFDGRSIQRGAHPTFGMAACLKEGELAVPMKMTNGVFVAGKNIDEVLKKAGLQHEAYADMWQTESYEDYCQDEVTYRRITGKIRRYNIRAKGFESEKLISEEFIMADPQRDVRNAAQAEKRRSAAAKRKGYRSSGGVYAAGSVKHRMPKKGDRMNGADVTLFDLFVPLNA